MVVLPHEDAIALLRSAQDEYALPLLGRILEAFEQGPEYTRVWLETEHPRLRGRSPLTCIGFGMFASVTLAFDADFVSAPITPAVLS